jgi:hypothetical protein
MKPRNGWGTRRSGWVESAKSQCRSFDSSHRSGLAQDDSVGLMVVLSHPFRNETAKWMGHPRVGELAGSCDPRVSKSRPGAPAGRWLRQDDSVGLMVVFSHPSEARMGHPQFVVGGERSEWFVFSHPFRNETAKWMGHAVSDLAARLPEPNALPVSGILAAEETRDETHRKTYAHQPRRNG